jgi:hypothetical protein
MGNILQYQHRGPTTARECHDPSEIEVIEFPKTNIADGAEMDPRSTSERIESRCFLKNREFELRAYHNAVANAIARNNNKYFLEYGKQILDELWRLDERMKIYSGYLGAQQTPAKIPGGRPRGDPDLEECIEQALTIIRGAKDLRTAIETKLSEEHERRKILRLV